MEFKKAIKEKLWIKVLLSGPSGSGKTYSSLRLATGLFSKVGGTGIAYIDTENRRASYYANEFDFDVIDLNEPYTPEKYMDAIDSAISAGYKVLIIDSLSLEWKYLNDVHDNMPGNSFTNWGKLKPRHNRFMEKILQSKIHIIATARGKDAYVLEEKNGKQSPKKVGEGIVGDKELEYNYTCTFQLSLDNHVASVMKDNTHVFENRYDVLKENDGMLLFEWANDGKDVVRPNNPSTDIIDDNSDANEVSKKRMEIKSLIDSLINNDTVSKEEVSNIVKKYNIVNGKASANYQKINDIGLLNSIFDELNGFNMLNEEGESEEE